MIITQGTRVRVTHLRSGTWEAVAKSDFDTALSDWFPLVLAEGQHAKGLSSGYGPGNDIPCRRSLVRSIERLKEPDRP